MKAFLKINEIQNRYGDKLQYFLVGLNDAENGKDIEKMYERLRKKYNLVLPVAYDSVLVSKWDIHSMPYILIVDPEGIVRQITGGRDLTLERIGRMLDGEKVMFYEKDPKIKEYDPNLSGKELLFRSVLSKWNGQQQAAYVKIEDCPTIQTEQSFKVYMVTLEWLYNYAYLGTLDWSGSINRRNPLYGSFYPHPILNLLDSSKFQADFLFNVGMGC